MTTWTTDTENLLEAIRSSSSVMCDYHKKRYQYLRSYLKWFKLPLILLSGMSVFFSSGLTPYLEVGYISLLTVGVSVICSILSSVELYLGTESSMASELVASKDYYLLSCGVYRVLVLERESRSQPAKEFLEESCAQYTKLLESSSLPSKKVKDSLKPVVSGSDRDTSSDISTDRV